MNTTATITDEKKAKINGSSLLAIPENLRARFFASSPPHQQKELGQFLTPPHVADLMASMFERRFRTFCLLDAGAGMGILSAAFVYRQLLRKHPPKRIEVTAYEMDKAFIRADGGVADWGTAQLVGPHSPRTLLRRRGCVRCGPRLSLGVG